MKKILLIAAAAAVVGLAGLGTSAYAQSQPAGATDPSTPAQAQKMRPGVKTPAMKKRSSMKRSKMRRSSMRGKNM